MVQLAVNFQSLGDFRKLQIKGFKAVYLYCLISIVETMEGLQRQAKVGFTGTPYEMRCYKRSHGDNAAFLNVRVESEAIAQILGDWDSGKITAKQAQNLLAAMVEAPVHNALVKAGFHKDSENFSRDSFTFEDIKNIIVETLK